MSRALHCLRRAYGGAPHGAFPPRAGSPSDASDVAACLSHDRIQVEAIGPSSGAAERRQSIRGASEEPVGSHVVPAGGMGHGNTDLREPLPEISLLDRAGLPSSLEHLVCREGPPTLHQFSSRLDGVFRGQRLLRDGCDPLGTVRQWSAQGVPRPRLACATLRVPVTIRSRHATQSPNWLARLHVAAVLELEQVDTGHESVQRRHHGFKPADGNLWPVAAQQRHHPSP